MEIRRNILPYIALGTGIIALGFSAIFVRWASAPGPVMGFYRLGIATLIMAPFFFKNINKRAISLKRFPVYAFWGGIFTAVDIGVWNTSVNYTTAANATLFANTAPLWVALIAWLLFRERLSRIFWIGLGATLCGAVLVLRGDFLHHPALGWGDILALIAGIFYAGYFLAAQRGRQYLDTVSFIWLVGLVSTLSLVVVCVGLDLPLTGYPVKTYLAFLGAALVSQILGYLSVGYALGHLPASTVSPSMVAQPVVTALIAVPILGEGLTLTQVFGGGLVLLGIYLVHINRRKMKKPYSPR